MMNMPTSLDTENLSDTGSKTTEKTSVKKTIAKRRAKATEQQKEDVYYLLKQKPMTQLWLVQGYRVLRPHISYSKLAMIIMSC
ncbi:hypothetical protein [Acinetobacter celticus]|uniref:hypothetical protein n=1 Tax=Acinetobacter celticus TaxID=1891224 RepID=UPI0011461E88|nr:hypothetical protein [Acinetobacter celticus]